MKKILSLLLALLLVGCSNSTPTPTETPSSTVTPTVTPVVVADPIDVKVTGLSGPTTMGLVKMMDDVDNGLITSNNYEINIAKSPDELVPLVAKGEVDIALLPSNLGANLFKQTKGNVQALTINTLGVLYVVEKGNNINTINDLEGKTLCATGKGATPELSLNHVLSLNGLTDKVTLEFKSAPNECIALMQADKNTISMLPEPFVTTALKGDEELRVALDLTKEWDAVETNSQIVTGITIVNTQFAKENPEAVKDFLTHYQESINYVNSDVENGAKLVGKYNIVPEPIAKIAIPKANIVFIEGDEMKNTLSGYLQVLFDQNPKLVGGAMPTDEFYYAE